MALLFEIDGVAAFPYNTGGYRVELPDDDLSVVDDIFVYLEGDNKFRIVPHVKGMYYASWRLNTTGNKNARLQEMLDHADISCLVIDKVFTNGSSLTIPATKVMAFERGGRISGGSIVNGFITAESEFQIFTTSTTLTNVKTPSGIFHCKWFGALGNDSNDDQPALQKGLDYVVHNEAGVKRFLLSAGVFRINKGLLAWKDSDSDGNPEQVNISIEGSATGFTTQAGVETTLRCMHSDNFGLAIQKGKGAVVKNLCIQGTNLLYYDLATAWGGSATYVQGSQRTHFKSPYSGLVFDAFGSSVTQSGDQYPGFESYYAGILGNGGSTDCKVSNVFINGFVCGIILSPNTNTQNNEGHIFENIWFSNCKDGFCTTNSQERTVVCNNFRFWESVHTCFRTNIYGLGRGEVPQINSANIAGNIFQWCHFSGSGGYFPIVNFNNCYAESFYQIGMINAITIQFNNCHISFGDPEPAGVKLPDFILVGTDAYFFNCVVILYGGAYMPFNIYGRAKFVNCLLQNPICCPNGNWTSDMYQVEYEGCRFYVDGGFVSEGSFESFSNGYQNLTFGSQLELATYNKEYTTVKPADADLNSANFFAQYRKVKSPLVRRIFIHAAVPVTVTGNEARIADSIGGTGYRYILGGMLVYASITMVSHMGTSVGGAVMRLSGYDAGTNEYIFDKVVNSMVTGTYSLWAVTINAIGTVGFCDIADPVTVTNVVREGQTTGYTFPLGYNMISNVIYSVASSSPGAATLGYGGGLQSCLQAIIANYEYEEYGTSYRHPLQNNHVPNGTAFTRGSIYKNLRGAGADSLPGDELPLGWMCSKSGVKGSPSPPEFVEINFGVSSTQIITIDSFTTNIDTSRPVGGDILVKILVKPASDLAAFKVGTTSGGEEVLPETDIVGGIWTVVTAPEYYMDPPGGSLFFGGITSSTQIKLFKTSAI